MATLIFKNLFRRQTRTLFTVLGIAVGVSGIAALGAVGGLCRASRATILRPVEALRHVWARGKKQEERRDCRK